MAQNFDDFLTTYDYTAIEAMPYMEGAADHARTMDGNTHRKSLRTPSGIAQDGI